MDEDLDSQYLKSRLQIINSICIHRSCEKEKFQLEEVRVGPTSIVAAFPEAVFSNTDVNQKRRYFELNYLGSWRENYKHL